MLFHIRNNPPELVFVLLEHEKLIKAFRAAQMLLKRNCSEEDFMIYEQDLKSSLHMLKDDDGTVSVTFQLPIKISVPEDFLAYC